MKKEDNQTIWFELRLYQPEFYGCQICLSEPEFNSGDKINIRASQDTLNSIALVKALIDVSGQTSDFTVQAPLVAYDKNGQAVNAEIVPDKVNATVRYLRQAVK